MPTPGSKSPHLDRHSPRGRSVPTESDGATGTSSANTPTDIDPERIVSLGLDQGAGGPHFDAALDAMLASARLESLLNLLDAAPDGDFAGMAWSYLDGHHILWVALNEARIDFAVLDRIVRRKRLSAVDPILDVAERTGDARLRERLLDTLQVLGDGAGPFVTRRLDSSRADLRRDLFLFLGKLEALPDGIDFSRFLLHQDSAVRRQAIRLMLKFVETREQAIRASLAETDERAVFYGLNAALEGGCPPSALPLVRQRIDADDLDSSLTILAIRVLAAGDSKASPVLAGRGRTSQMMRAFQVKDAPFGMTTANKTLQWLIGKVARKSRFLRRWELRPKSPVMLASLGALAAYWGAERDVVDILGLARTSGDADHRKALGAKRVTGKFSASDAKR